MPSVGSFENRAPQIAAKCGVTAEEPIQSGRDVLHQFLSVLDVLRRSHGRIEALDDDVIERFGKALLGLKVMDDQ